ncbi:MAG: T9SS type A sorting domain-containing protein, partial [Cytophagaceae bacterium]|nr:T9SS type A sorting domain-containing protein [Cytophagaceae bacterium]
QNNNVSNNLNAGGGFVTNHGIVVQQGGQILIGGTGASQPNIINSNGTHGVFVFDGANNVQMTRNIISCNTSMGISLNVSGDPNTIGTKVVGNTSMTTGPTLSTTGCPGAGLPGSGNASGTSPGTNATIEVFSTPPCKTCPNVLRGEADSYQQTVTASGTTWSATGVTGNVSVTATNSTGSGGYFPTSRFSDCQVCSLPITLLYFNGHRNNFEVLLTWATAMELNNKEFTIERSENGHTFYPIGTVAGAVNSSSVISYQFVDKQPLPGVSYYRLKQEDIDGTHSLSRIIAVSDKKASGLIVFPNPSQSDVTVIASNNDLNGASSIRIYNVLGQEVFVSLVSAEALRTGVHLELSSLPQGTYTLKLVTSSEEWIEQLIKR